MAQCQRRWMLHCVWTCLRCVSVFRHVRIVFNTSVFRGCNCLQEVLFVNFSPHYTHRLFFRLCTSLSAALPLHYQTNKCQHHETGNTQPVHDLPRVIYIFLISLSPQGNRRTWGCHGNWSLATTPNWSWAAPGPDGSCQRWVLYLLMLSSSPHTSCSTPGVVL